MTKVWFMNSQQISAFTNYKPCIPLEAHLHGLSNHRNIINVKILKVYVKISLILIWQLSHNMLISTNQSLLRYPPNNISIGSYHLAELNPRNRNAIRTFPNILYLFWPFFSQTITTTSQTSEHKKNPH